MTVPLHIIVLSGLSGSGKSTAIRALEDAGYFCIDNLPIVLLPKLLEVFAHGASDMQRMAIVIDAREGRFLDATPQAVQDARAAGHRVDVLFLDATDDAITRRFSETRRRHPLAPFGTVAEGIASERSRLAALRSVADEVVDTTRLNAHELKSLLTERYGHEGAPELAVQVLSFGFRHGVPPHADNVLDVRFLPNPYFVPDLKALPGTDQRVAQWVLAHNEAQLFLDHAASLLEFLLPRYRAEGKAYLTIALGCTGGRHRSVALAEELARRLSAKKHPARVRHRDVDRE